MEGAKRNRILCCLAMFAAMPLLPAVTLAASQEKPGILIEEILEEVQEGLVSAQGRLGEDSQLPPLKAVELILETAFTKKVTGGLNLWVLSFGSKMEKGDVSTLTLRLAPPTGKAAPVGVDDIRKTLSDMIVSAAVGTYKVRTGKTPLQLSEVIAELKFVVTRTGGGGTKFTVAPVTAELGGELANKAVQTIRVTFGKD